MVFQLLITLSFEKPHSSFSPLYNIPCESCKQLLGIPIHSPATFQNPNMKKLYFAYLKCLSFNKNFSLHRLHSDREHFIRMTLLPFALSPHNVLLIISIITSPTRDYILIANFIGMTLLPFALLAVLNFKLYSAIKELITLSFTISLLRKILHNP